MCLAYQSGSNTGIWDMTEGGGVLKKEALEVNVAKAGGTPSGK